MKNIKYLSAFLVGLMCLGASICFAKTTELIQPNQVIFNSMNTIIIQDAKVDAVMIKFVYPNRTGYRFGFGQETIIGENEKINYISEASLCFDAKNTYVLPRGTFEKIPMYGKYQGKSLTEARMEVFDGENDIKIRRLSNLIKAANSIEVTFTLKNGEKVVYEISSDVLQEWKQVIAYPEVI